MSFICFPPVLSVKRMYGIIVLNLCFFYALVNFKTFGTWAYNLKSGDTSAVTIIETVNLSSFIHSYTHILDITCIIPVLLFNTYKPILGY